MGKKGAIFSVLMLIVLAAGAYVGWQTSRVPSHLLLGAVDASGAFKHTEQDPYYTVEALYPNRTSLWRWWNPDPDTRARTIMETWLASDIAQFKQNIHADNITPDEKAQLGASGASYSYSVQYKHVTSSNDKLSSYEYDIYVDTGGAHPNGYFKTFVFDRNGTEIKLADLFIPGSEYLARMASTSLTQITKDMETRLGGAASTTLFVEGLAPKEENFSNFVIDGGSLVLLFPPYQVAAYAAGTFEVKIPLSELADILQPEWK